VLKREEWLPLARKLDWEFSYTTEQEVFPEVISGRPWLPHPQFDWAHKFYHTNNWCAIAAPHFFDGLTLGQNAIEFHIANNVILETDFTNLQFVGLASLAHVAGDYLFEKMVTSLQTDEARHAQIGHPVLTRVIEHDPEYAQYSIDKWYPSAGCA
jgi:toluene monooxygenase system protein A